MLRLILLWILIATFAGAQSFDGIWRSQGYGFVFEIHGPALKAFEVTASTCVPGFTADLDSAGSMFKTKDGDVFSFRLGGAADRALLHFEGVAADIHMDRLPHLPAVCQHFTENTPPGNFEVFTRTWGENYILDANWEQIVERYWTKVTPQTTPAQLFDIFEEMIKPLNDSHTFLVAPELKRQFSGRWRAGTDPVVKKDFETRGRQDLFAVTDRKYLRGPVRKFCNDQIQYGQVDNATGYLRILSFGGYAKNGNYAQRLEALESALDEIFSDTQIRALIIDLRLSFGGDDPLGLAIASRLTTNEYLAYSKAARANSDGRDRWTPGQPIMVRPSARPGFRGPIVELIGPVARSAAETFTQALMSRTPHVTRIGENTQGVFSDVLERKLPNGWTFYLPNEVFRTPQGTTFDGTGIPPDIEVPVFTDRDIAEGRDPAMEKALEIFRKK